VIYKAYHCCSRVHSDYYTTDIISELLGTGDSSRLHETLVDKLDVCTEVDCYISGTDDENLLLVEAKPNDGISLEELDLAIQKALKEFCEQALKERELEKVINKACNYLSFTNENHHNKAFNLAYFKSIEKLELYNNEQSEYRAVTPEQILRVSNEILNESNCNTLYYKSSKS
jgi:predicted Zn-dependent peptidase